MKKFIKKKQKNKTSLRVKLIINNNLQGNLLIIIK